MRNKIETQYTKDLDLEIKDAWGGCGKKVVEGNNTFICGEKINGTGTKFYCEEESCEADEVTLKILKKKKEAYIEGYNDALEKENEQ